MGPFFHPVKKKAWELLSVGAFVLYSGGNREKERDNGESTTSLINMMVHYIVYVIGYVIPVNTFCDITEILLNTV